MSATHPNPHCGRTDAVTNLCCTVYFHCFAFKSITASLQRTSEQTATGKSWPSTKVLLKYNEILPWRKGEGHGWAESAELVAIHHCCPLTEWWLKCERGQSEWIWGLCSGRKGTSYATAPLAELTVIELSIWEAEFLPYSCCHLFGWNKG